MKVFTIESELGHLQLGERSAPQPGYGQILVDVKAVSLNFRDLLLATTSVLNAPNTSGLIACSDGAGWYAGQAGGVST